MTSRLKDRSLIDVSDLTTDEIRHFLKQAKDLKKKILDNPDNYSPPCNKSAVLMFFEPSTRTRASFEMSAQRLGLRVMNLDYSGSSSQKGETIFDTAQNIAALMPHMLIIRHSGSGVPYQISKLVKVPVVNAGDGFHAHPTQALLDAFTMQETFGDKLNQKKVLIIGDIAHSRVARSNILLLNKLGVSVDVCGPPTLIPPFANELGVQVFFDLDKIISNYDVIMALRMQTERQNSFQVPSLKEYSSRFGLTQERLAKIKETAILLHPGPINRGVEMGSAATDDRRSRVMDQVQNGIVVRTLLLSEILGVQV